MEPLLTIRKPPYTLEVHQDDMDGDGPRDWDNLGKMVCFHPRYSLGDEHDYREPQELMRDISEQGGVYLPLYLIDHSGISTNTTGFGFCDPQGWDSGQVGIIWCPAEKIREEYGVQRITKRTREKVRDCLRGEVETYDQYLTGQVYGFILYRDHDPGSCECCERDFVPEVEHSCWGFYGDDWKENGILEHLPDEIAAALIAGDYDD